MMSEAKRVEDWKFQGVLTTETESRVPASKPSYDRSSSGSNGTNHRSGSGFSNQNTKPSKNTASNGQVVKARGPPNKATTTHYRLKP